MKLYLLALILVVIAFAPLYPVYRGRVTGKKAKRNIIINLASFASCLAIMVLITTNYASAAAEADLGMGVGIGFLSAALATGLSCIGAGIAVATAASSALGAISENPSILGKSLIFVALAEGVALYGLIVSILIINKLPSIVL